MSQQIRFHDGSLGEPTDGTLRILEVDFGSLDANQRKLLWRHMRDAGSDLWQFHWTRLASDGGRTEHSTIQKSDKRIIAKAQTVIAVLEALAENEAALERTAAHRYVAV